MEYNTNMRILLSVNMYMYYTFYKTLYHTSLTTPFVQKLLIREKCDETPFSIS